LRDAVLPVMAAAGGRRIIKLSSTAAQQSLEGWSAYCASSNASVTRPALS
jgi:NADP-dependent 3-hydroxy acid dehydrogenase YdfG